MIGTFGDKGTEDVFHGKNSAEARKTVPTDLVRVAVRKLDMIEAAHRLEDLKAPPANRLEAQKGNLAGWHSIRINDQYRVIFKWVDGRAENVRIVDYH